MKNMKKIFFWLLLSLCLLGAGGALAVTEGIVEEAPPVDMTAFEQEQELSYLPDASYYGQEGANFAEPGWGTSEVYVEPQTYSGDSLYEDLCQTPGLTAGEIVRAKALLADYEAGRATGDGASVLGQTENVVLGVYALDPAQWDGEAVYVLLPGTCLTDGQILAVIDAYHQLGLTFDPEGLGYRNCARGGGIETSRIYTQEEQMRLSTIFDLIQRGKLAQALLEDIEAQETQIREIGLNPAYYSGLEGFHMLPYRRVTDEEIVAQLVTRGVHDESQVIDVIEREARTVLCGRLKCPLSMELEYAGTGGVTMQSYFDENGVESWDYETEIETSHAMFQYTDERGKACSGSVAFERDSGDFIRAAWVEYGEEEANGEAQSGEGEQADEEACLLAAEAYAGETLGLTGLTFFMQENTQIQWGMCRQARARLADGLWLTVYVGLTDGQVHGAEFASGMDGTASGPVNQ